MCMQAHMALKCGLGAVNSSVATHKPTQVFCAIVSVNIWHGRSAQEVGGAVQACLQACSSRLSLELIKQECSSRLNL